MGFIYSILTVLFLSGSVTDVPYSSVESAFKTGDAKDLVALSKDKILINVLGNEGVYSKSQATLVLKGFFTKHPVKSFSYVHKGKGSSEGSFAIGEYVSGSQKFRVTIHFKKVGNDFKIESLAIEE